MKALLRWSVETELIEKLPFKIVFLKAPRRQIIPLLSSEDIQKLLDCAETRYRLILLIAASIGMRLGEILMLTWGAVFFEEKRLAIQDNPEWGWSTKPGENRSVSISQRVADELQSWKAKSRFDRDEDIVLSTGSRTPMKADNAVVGIRKAFVKTGLYKKGLPLSHRLRRNAASNLLGAGVNIETVRNQLDCASATTTMLYAHTADERMKRASEILDF